MNQNENKYIGLSPDDKLKYEIAEELGLSLKVSEKGWKSLTSRESGQIGGIMRKRKRDKSNENH